MDTIGILCARGAESPFERALPRVLRGLPPQEQAGLLVFSLSQVHLEEGMTGGLLVTGEGVRAAWMPLPAVVFNTAVQHRRSGIRTMRALLEAPGCRVLNPSNRIDQRQVRQMLLSDPALAPAVPPEAGDVSLDALPGFVRRPALGMSVSRIVCGRRTEDGWDLLNWESDPIRRAASAETALGPAGETLTLRLPADALGDARDRRGQPLFIRSFLQKNARGEWEILRHVGLFPPGRSPCRADAAARKFLPAAAGRVGCYLPDMVLCTVDLLLGADGAPYCLGMGGWPPDRADMRAIPKARLLGNMLGYARRILHN